MTQLEHRTRSIAITTWNAPDRPRLQSKKSETAVKQDHVRQYLHATHIWCHWYRLYPLTTLLNVLAWTSSWSNICGWGGARVESSHHDIHQRQIHGLPEARGFEIFAEFHSLTSTSTSTVGPWCRRAILQRRLRRGPCLTWQMSIPQRLQTLPRCW